MADGATVTQIRDVWGADNLQSAQVLVQAVDRTTTVIDLQSARRAVTVINNSAVVVEIGGRGVTWGNGFPLSPGMGKVLLVRGLVCACVDPLGVDGKVAWLAESSDAPGGTC